MLLAVHYLVRRYVGRGPKAERAAVVRSFVHNREGGTLCPRRQRPAAARLPQACIWRSNSETAAGGWASRRVRDRIRATARSQRETVLWCCERSRAREAASASQPRRGW